MKAVMMDEVGGPEVLYLGDAPDPEADEGDVVVDVHAASVNPADWKVRSAIGYSADDLVFPQILGRDFSGVVSAVGSGVTDLAVGDEVWGVLDRGVEGAYAEKVAIPANLVGKKPANVDHIEAAALSLTGLTALIALEDTLHLKKDQKILIQGGAGGVGSFAVQLAHYIGAQVITTASARNHDYLKAFGADEVIDYNAVDFTTVVSDCDCVFDTVGGEVQLRSYAVLKPGGKLAWISPAPKGSEPPRDDVESGRPNVVRHRDYMDRIAALVSAGTAKPPEIKIMSMADAVDAHRESESGHVRGKIVFKVR